MEQSTGPASAFPSATKLIARFWMPMAGTTCCALNREAYPPLTRSTGAMLPAADGAGTARSWPELGSE